MELNQIHKYINRVGKSAPSVIKILTANKLYGYHIYNVAYGLYHRHASFKRLMNNVKQIILCQKN